MGKATDIAGGYVGSARRLGLFTILCIGLNNVIGSGIYRLPARVAGDLGPAGWLAFAIDALVLVAVALCFAECAGLFDESGGPYAYAKDAFGWWTAFAVGWTAWIATWTALAGVASAVPAYLAVIVPGADEPVPKTALAAGIVVFLGVVNHVGVRPAAWTQNLLAVAKVLPLVVFVAIGIGHLRPGEGPALEISPAASSAAAAGEAWTPVEEGASGATPWGALAAAMFAAFFALQGFEVVPVPAGEALRPKRDVPLAVVASLLGAGALYVGVQIVGYGTRPPGAAWEASERPLAESAATFLGEPGRMLMAVGAVLSMLGFCAVTALCAPRYLVALGIDALLPKSLAVPHPRFDTPWLAVWATTAAALAAVLASGFDTLINLSNVAVVVQYAATCAAVVRLRSKRRDLPRPFRVPGGRFLVPSIGLAASLLFGALLTREPDAGVQYGAFAAWIVVGVVIALGTRLYHSLHWSE